MQQPLAGVVHGPLEDLKAFAFAAWLHPSVPLADATGVLGTKWLVLVLALAGISMHLPHSAWLLLCMPFRPILALPH